MRAYPAATTGSPLSNGTSTDVVGRTTYRLETTATVHAAVTMSAAGALAGWAVEPSAGAAQSITVYP